MITAPLLMTAIVLVIINSILRSREPAKLSRQVKHHLNTIHSMEIINKALTEEVSSTLDDRMRLQKGIKRLMNCIQWLAVDGSNEQCGKFYDLAGDGYNGMEKAMNYYDDLRANRPSKPVPQKDDAAKPNCAQIVTDKLVTIHGDAEIC